MPGFSTRVDDMSDYGILSVLSIDASNLVPQLLTSGFSPYTKRGHSLRPEKNQEGIKNQQLHRQYDKLG
jgi:hypothetical protein